ncbi:MAG: hypothetical protein NXI32_20190 [bacterium]|nr:hypothetical protein [bacterium]
MLLQGLISFFLAMLKSRRWSQAFFPSLFLSVPLLCICGLVLYGLFKSDKNIIRDYQAMLEDLEGPNVRPALMADDSQANSGGDLELLADRERASGQATQAKSLMLRRILKLRNYDDRSCYLVALELEREGRKGAARNLMRRAAPLDEAQSGFRPAHAWLAADLLSRADAFTDKDQRTLFSDLERAVEWEGVSPKLLTLYATALRRERSLEAGIEFLQKKKSEHPMLNILLAEFAFKAGKERDFEAAANEALRYLADKIESKTASTLEFVDLAKIYALKHEFDNAVKSINAGMVVNDREPDSEARQKNLAVLRRILSNVMCIQYEDAGGVEMISEPKSVEFLDDAVRSDPTNPWALELVAELLVNDGDANSFWTSSLEESLKEGTANFVTYLALGTHWLEQNRTAEALPLLETAVRRIPSNPIALNNLALALAKGESADCNRAIELIDRALKTPGISQPLCATLFDTKGQILEKMDDTTGAILCYEDAIRIDRNKLETRERLAAAFEEVGMTDIAKSQRDYIEELKAMLAQKDEGQPE